MNYSIIRNDEQYELYLERFSEIFDIDFSKYPEHEDEFDLLSLLIEDYEKKNHSIETPSPIEYIKFIMDQRNLTNKDMEKYLGSPSKVSEVLRGQRNLSISMIKKLHKGLNIPLDLLIQDIDATDSVESINLDEFLANGIFDIYRRLSIDAENTMQESYQLLAQSKLDKPLHTVKSFFNISNDKYGFNVHF